MSRYAYLLCESTRKVLWLGKALFTRVDNKLFGFSNESNELYTRALWKFLADHAEREVVVKIEYKFDDELPPYVEIGGDMMGDIVARQNNGSDKSG